MEKRKLQERTYSINLSSKISICLCTVIHVIRICKEKSVGLSFKLFIEETTSDWD